MAEISGAPSSSMYIRWMSLLVVLANIAIADVYTNLSGPPTFAEVVAEYGNAFLPAGYANAVRLTILGAFLLFFAAALRPRKRPRRIYDRLMIPVALTSTLATCWFVAFKLGWFGLTAGLIAASVVLAALMFLRVASVSPTKYSHWLRVPFSLYFGAMTLALLVAITQWLNASGVLNGTAVATEDVATAFLAIAAWAGGFIAIRYSDAVYPAVIASGVGAMFIAQRGYDQNVAADAFIVCVGMLVVVGLAALALARKPRRDPKIISARRGILSDRRSADDGWHALDGNSSIMRL